jgi:hypothetical protein
MKSTGPWKFGRPGGQKYGLQDSNSRLRRPQVLGNPEAGDSHPSRATKTPPITLNGGVFSSGLGLWLTPAQIAVAGLPAGYG